jgi:hypothetical protein
MSWLPKVSRFRFLTKLCKTWVEGRRVESDIAGESGDKVKTCILYLFVLLSGPLICNLASAALPKFVNDEGRIWPAEKFDPVGGHGTRITYLQFGLDTWKRARHIS